MVAAFTGYRPPKLGGYSKEVADRLRGLASAFIDKERPEKVVTGMALGWDQAVALAAIEKGVPFVAAIPCDVQDKLWPDASKALYKAILEKASEAVVVSLGGYAAWKMQARNKWMVDAASLLVALWDGSDGGTANCVRYAESRSVRIVNLWESWAEGQSHQQF
jgi:uncharacterized phage-like protein YoqJ